MASDADGIRAAVKGPDAATYYVGNYEYDTPAGVTVHYRLGGRRVGHRAGGSLKIVVTDLVGSTAAVIDADTGDVARLRYLPYGLPRGTGGHPDVGSDRLYTGQRSDDSGLMFYNARYYDPTIGRFAQPDTIVPNPIDPRTSTATPTPPTTPSATPTPPATTSPKAPATNPHPPLPTPIFPTHRRTIRPRRLRQTNLTCPRPARMSQSKKNRRTRMASAGWDGAKEGSDWLVFGLTAGAIGQAVHPFDAGIVGDVTFGSGAVAVGAVNTGMHCLDADRFECALFPAACLARS